MVEAAFAFLNRRLRMLRMAAGKDFDAHAAKAGLAFPQACLFTQVHTGADVFDRRFWRKRPQWAGRRLAPKITHFALLARHDVANGMHQRVRAVNVVGVVGLLSSRITVGQGHARTNVAGLTAVELFSLYKDLRNEQVILHAQFFTNFVRPLFFRTDNAIIPAGLLSKSLLLDQPAPDQRW